MMYQTIKCRICQMNFDSSKNLPRILINCGHTICTTCIENGLKSNKNNQFECPIDHLLYEDIKSPQNFPENKAILKLIYDDKVQTLLKESNSLSNSIKFPSMIYTQHKAEYLKKSSMLKSSIRSPNDPDCPLHSLPLDVICIDEKKKICKQCALLPDHSNHIIITDEEFMNQIDALIDLFSDVSEKIDLYSTKEDDNISASSYLSDILQQYDDIKKLIETKSNELIAHIINEKNTIFSFLDSRKKELRQNFENIRIDLKSINNQTNNWMERVKTKLDILNDIENPSSDCIKLVEKDPSKNLTNLLSIGHQIIDRYSFVSKTEETIKNLENYKNEGLKVDINKPFVQFCFDGCDAIQEDGPSGLCTKTRFFEVNENEEKVNNLNLKKRLFKTFDINKAINEKYNLLNKNNNIVINNYNSDKILIDNKKFTNQIIENKIDDTNDEVKFTNKIPKDVLTSFDFNDNGDSDIANYRDNNIMNHRQEMSCNNLNAATLNEISLDHRNKSKENKMKKSIIFDEDNEINYRESLNGKTNIDKNSQSGRKQGNKIKYRPGSRRGSKEKQEINKLLNSNNVLNTTYNLGNFNTQTNRNKKTAIPKSAAKNVASSNNINKTNMIFIKNQISKESANLSRIDIGEEGMNYICGLLDSKNYLHFNEIKMIKSNIDDDDVIKFFNCLHKNNVQVDNLYLGYNNLTDKSGEIIASTLSKSNSFKLINLNNNAFSSNMKKKIQSYSNSPKTGFQNTKIHI